jgi:hypothetical protein
VEKPYKIGPKLAYRGGCTLTPDPQPSTSQLLSASFGLEVIHIHAQTSQKVNKYHSESTVGRKASKKADFTPQNLKKFQP